MFTEISKIKNIGSFKDFTPSRNWEEVKLEKNNIFYALNGHWKTTLSAILNSIKNVDNNSIHWRKTLWEIWDLECIIKRDTTTYKIDNKKWTKNWAVLDEKDVNIIIFDDNYINNNIFSEKFEFEHKKSLHKIIFWEGWIKLNNELNWIKKIKDDNKTQLTILENTLSEFTPIYNLDQYIKYDISKLNETDLKKEVIEIEKKIKNINEQSQIKAKENLWELQEFDYILEKIDNDFSNLKVSWEAHNKAKIEVEKFKNNYFNDSHNSEDFLKNWLKNIKNNKCSFCHQDLHNQVDLIEIYKDFFDTEYDKLHNKLNTHYTTYKTYNFELDIRKLNENLSKNIKLYSYWSSNIKNLDLLLDINNLEKYIKIIQDTYENIIKDFDIKLKDLNSDFNNNNILLLIENVKKCNTFIKQYNLIIENNNILIKAFKDWLDSSDLVSLKNKKRENEIKLIRLSKDEILKIDNYKSKQSEIIENDKEIEKKREELNNYTKVVIDDYEKLINEKLENLWIFNFTIWHITPTTHVNGSYVEIVIKINWKKINLKDYDDEKPSFKNTLSRWDKNSLAFAFFLAFLEKKQNKENLILIFDDPLSSHDENRQDDTAFEIKKLSNLVKQVIILTHKKDFFKTLNDKFSSCTDLSYFEIQKLWTGSKINKIKPNKFLQNQIQKIITKFQEFINWEPTDLRADHLLNDIRKLFEWILRTKYYIKTRDHNTIMQWDKLKIVFFDNNLLIDIKDDLLDLAQISNWGSHIWYDWLNTEQMKSKIKKTLSLIEKI